jgi:hypothetical protein
VPLGSEPNATSGDVLLSSEPNATSDVRLCSEPDADRWQRATRQRMRRDKTVPIR